MAIDSLELTQQQENWFGDDEAPTAYRLTVHSAAPEFTSTTTVYCEQVPSDWLTAGEIMQPVHISGFIVSPQGPSSPMQKNATLVGTRIEWVLDSRTTNSEHIIGGTSNANWKPAIPPQMQRIGLMGWNLAHSDLIRKNSKQRITSDEADAFYSFIAAASKLKNVSSDEIIKSPSPVDVLEAPELNLAMPIDWHVRLVSGTVVNVPPLAPQAALGGQRYFQLDGMVSTGDRTIAYSVPTKTGANDRIDFQREFPITLVTTDASLVPKDVQAGERTSWEISQHMRVAGTFYRLWAYQSDLVQSKNSNARQAAPLVVVTDLTPSPPPLRKRPSAIGWFGVAFTAVILALLALILYFALKRDIPRRNRTSLN